MVDSLYDRTLGLVRERQQEITQVSGFIHACVCNQQCYGVPDRKLFSHKILPQFWHPLGRRVAT